MSQPITDLSLRDFFAAQCAGHIYAGFDADALEATDLPCDNEALTRQTAAVAYMIADAMLKQRERK